MKGLDKFKTEIKAEVDKVKDNDKKKLIKAEADEIIKHIESVCDEEYDNLMAQDHKSFVRMWKFVTTKAKDYAINNCAMVKDSLVFGWIDEYVGLDDKAEVEKEKNKAKENADDIKKHIEQIKSEVTKKPEPKKTVQMDILSLANSDKAETSQASIFDLF